MTTSCPSSSAARSMTLGTCGRARSVAQPQGRGRGRSEPDGVRRTDDARAGAACHHDQLDRPRRARLGAGAHRPDLRLDHDPNVRRFSRGAPSALSPPPTTIATTTTTSTSTQTSPGRTVTVTDAGGRTATWHTNASGYADVYLNAGSDAAGHDDNRARRQRILPGHAVTRTVVIVVPDACATDDERAFSPACRGPSSRPCSAATRNAARSTVPSPSSRTLATCGGRSASPSGDGTPKSGSPVTAHAA